jgi:hypothetical protein
MASRPKRVCTERTRERIARILEWENCTEDSKMFKEAAAQIDREFKTSDGDSDYVSANEEEDTGDESEMDEDSCAHSPPSSAEAIQDEDGGAETKTSEEWHPPLVYPH